jgi:NitT/TauT family transport system substrate-binding protein
MAAGVRFRTLAAPILALGALALAAASPACGQTNFGQTNLGGPVKLRVGNSAAQAFSFIPVEVGIREGIFAKDGIAVESIAFGGSGKQHQAMAAGAIDIALSGGSDLSYVAKGAPEIAIAEMAGPPLFLGVVVPYNSPLKGPDDLKGKKISVSSGAGVTRWLIQKLVQQKGWGPDGVILVAAGGSWAADIAALVTGQVDAAVTAAALGFKLEETKQGRLLFSTSEIEHDFIQHAIFASTAILQENPEAVRSFLKAWFETIVWMRGHKAESVAIARSITGFSPEVESREYDLVMPMFTTDGHFQAAGLKTIEQSFKDLHLVDGDPEMSKLYTEAYLPKD